MSFSRGGRSSSGGGTGADGASAYQVAVANGFVGTQSQWLASLVGPAGPGGGGGGGDVIRVSRAGLLAPTTLADVPMPILVPVELTVTGMWFSAGQAPTGSPIVIDVLLGGVTMFPGGTGRPTIQPTQLNTLVVVPPDPVIPALAKLTVVLVSVGSTSQGINVSGVIW